MNKRKSRGGSVRAQRQRSLVTDGVYSNAIFMHSATAQVGNIARITTSSREVWEGVFKTFSQNFDVVLEVAARLENPDSPDPRLLTETHVERMIFKPGDILTMTFRNVDLDYPVKDVLHFQTDSAISARLNGNKGEEKELEPWDAGQINGNDNLNLDLEASNGWDVQDMFRKNEQDYGVQSTFDHSLRGYTVPLQTSDSADYREAQAKADQIANEIESQPAYKARLELENGDEEAVFAAVVRPNQQQESSNGKYIPPAKRKGQNNGKLVRSTPPPSSGSSSQNSPSPKDTRPPVQYPPHANHPVHQNNIQQLPNPPLPDHPQQPPQQIQHVPPPQHMHVPAQVVPPQMQNIPMQMHQQPMPMQQQHVPLPNNPPPRPNSHTPPHQYQQGPPPRQGGPHGLPHAGVPPHGKPQMNGEIKSGPQQRQQRHQQQYQQQQQQMQERVAQVVPPGLPQGPPPQQVAYQQEVKQDSPQSHTIPQQPQPQIPQPRQQPPPHQQPRHEGPLTPQNQEALKELHVFSQDFKLAPLPQHTSPTLPPASAQQQHVPQSHTPHMSGAESPQLVPHMGPPVQGHSAGTSPNGSSSSTMSTMNSGADQSQSSVGSQKQPSPAQSPPSESDKLQNTVAKSKLNPNAKEFVLNPAAKPFQPRSPSTPSASRPHTPQTPSHSPYITATVSGPGGPQLTQMMMPLHYMAISQPQYQPPPPQTNRIRKIPMGQIRTDMASQMQHAAAVTGQPLLAPAPLPQFIYNPGAAAAAAAHGMNQAAAYQPATVAAMHAATIRMYDAAAAAAAPQQIPYLPPQPSGTPSPAQAPYNPAAVQQQQGPPQGYQYPHLQSVPPQQAPPQIPMFCIPTQHHMLPNVPYLQQAPPPGPHAQHVQVLVQHQHPSQGGNPHGPNP